MILIGVIRRLSLAEHSPRWFGTLNYHARLRLCHTSVPVAIACDTLHLDQRRYHEYSYDCFRNVIDKICITFVSTPGVNSTNKSHINVDDVEI